MRNFDSEINFELARSLAYLPHRQEFYQQGGWCKAPPAHSPAFESFIKHYFTQLEWNTAKQKARSGLSNPPGCNSDRPHLSRNIAIQTQGFVFIQDNNYPALLKEIFDPPVVLFYWNSGIVSITGLNQFTSVSMVGTRNPHRICAALSPWLVKQFVTHWIVSGFARGVDRLVHTAAMDQYIPTVAVLGSGLWHTGPQSNRGLCAWAVQTRRPLLLISEFPDEVPGFPGNFPRRNRIIAGLSDSCIVLQAPYRSGALITARFALDEGRDVAAFDHPLLQKIPGSNEGARQLLDDGAQAIHAPPEIFAGLFDGVVCEIQSQPGLF